MKTKCSEKLSFPNSLKCLTIASTAYSIIRSESLFPRSLTKLVIDHSYYDCVRMYGSEIFSLLEFLTIEDYDNQSEDISDIKFPQTVKHLSLSGYFNRDLSFLKYPQLESLTLGDSFDKSIKNIHLPHSLKKLKLGYKFNQNIIDANLPELVDLEFGWRFNKSVRNANLPKSLQKMTVGWCFCQQNLDQCNLPKRLIIFQNKNDGKKILLYSSIPPIK